MGKIYFTQRGIDLFLQKIKRDEDVISEMFSRLGHLAEVGGDQYHDNFSYEQQTMELRMLSGKINEDYKVLENASIIKDSDKRDKSSVFIGATVKIEFNQDIQLWNILGYGESDPKNRNIAYNTPLGSALMGKKINDVFDYNINSRKVKIKILSID